jgi:hypothetical protein
MSVSAVETPPLATERLQTMKVSHRPAAITAGVILATALGTGVAMAASGPAPTTNPSVPATARPAPTTSESTTGSDTDTTQQGDQTTPDTAAGAAESSTDSSAESATESASSETGPSDGPGGHADPAGNVDHQATGNE